jgi:transposase-like protein
MAEQNDTIVVPNGDIVAVYTCNNCNKVFYEETLYTEFKPLKDISKTIKKKTKNSAKKRSKITDEK